MNVAVLAVASVLLSALLSASGALVILLGRDRLDVWQGYLVTLSVGAIFGGAFVHLVPRYAETFGFTPTTGLLIVLGIVGSYLVERAVHWHCHAFCDVEPYSVTLLTGDSIHNVLDGVIIASSYYVAVSAGVAATAAVAFHKVPKEVGDFGVLLRGGVPKWWAVGANVLTNAFALAGALAVVLVADVSGAVAVLVPLAVGNFVYVAGADLLPEMQVSETSTPVQAALLLLGAGLMYAGTFLRPLLG